MCDYVRDHNLYFKGRTINLKYIEIQKSGSQNKNQMHNWWNRKIQVKSKSKEYK